MAHKLNFEVDLKQFGMDFTGLNPEATADFLRGMVIGFNDYDRRLHYNRMLDVSDELNEQERTCLKAVLSGLWGG